MSKLLFSILLLTSVAHAQTKFHCETAQGLKDLAIMIEGVQAPTFFNKFKKGCQLVLDVMLEGKVLVHNQRFIHIEFPLDGHKTQLRVPLNVKNEALRYEGNASNPSMPFKFIGNWNGEKVYCKFVPEFLIHNGRNVCESEGEGNE